MRILVCPNTLIVGGASLDAIDLATAMRRRGHQVVILGPRGPLVDRLRSAGLEWIEAPSAAGGWPSMEAIRRIRSVVAERAIDVVHTYEWPRALEASCGAHLLDGTPVVASILSVDVPKFLPRSLRVIAGTTDVRDAYARRGFPNVTMIEPIVDLPAPVPPSRIGSFRSTHDLDGRFPTVVIASRLAVEKRDSLQSAMDAVELLEETCPVQLVIAGTGDCAPELEAHARALDERIGRRAVVFTGLLTGDDVDTLYASADLVLGMGTALLRGMAHGKPAIVVGTDGFSAPVTTERCNELAALGFWGVGPPDGAAARLASHMHDALRDTERTEVLAQASSSIIRSRPSRRSAESALEAVYLDAVRNPVPALRRAVHVGRGMGRFTVMRVRHHPWLRRARPAP